MYEGDKLYLTLKTAHRASGPLPLTLCILGGTTFGYDRYRQRRFEMMMDKRCEVACRCRTAPETVPLLASYGLVAPSASP